MADFPLLRWWRERDKPGWRNFGVAMAILLLAFLLALYSVAMSESSRPIFAWGSAILALLLAAWVAITIVPRMARRTSLRWLLYQVDYRPTREGGIYLAAIFIIALAAVNTGNNLLFLILSCLIAGILVSGIVSYAVLMGLDLNIELPEHVFAEQPILATVEVRNEKSITPSFSLRVVGLQSEEGAEILTQPVYFPYIPHENSARQKVELLFPRRGVYRQDAFGIRTKFPFGFLEKTRRVESELELVVYPRVEPTDEFFEILPLLSGEMESLHRGRGHDLYTIRDYLPTDSARFVDWKSSAKTGALKIREFAREDERRLVLALDPFLGRTASDSEEQTQSARFERAVSLAACITWHFYDTGAVMQFRLPGITTPMTTADDIVYDVLRELAFIQPQRENPDSAFMHSLSEETECFKIILTAQPRGTIPTSMWSSSYFIFLDSL
ncbi:MAG TPA: DUF58 domain-containing protein [Candidatus Acidoferrales bacterium]|nr:DUF58 domain-containing protein [Candidatus Acidoferrales bacterium]